MSQRRQLEATVETFAVDGAFVISRGRRTETTVVRVTVSESSCRGQGEGVPYSHYGESADSVLEQVEGVRAEVEGGVGRADLIDLLAAGAARAAIDAALWDLECALAKAPVETLLGSRLLPVQTVRTISLGEPAEMAERARRLSDWPMLKLKLGGEGDEERMRAVRRVVPDARLVVDANESWRPEDLDRLLEVAVSSRIEMVEQPLAPSDEDALADRRQGVAIGADESFHTAHDLERVARLYDFVNLKLDKTGGLTHALQIADQLSAHRLRMMVGCMLGTSLGMAPALVLAQRAELVDLDAPYLLAQDRKETLVLGETGLLGHNQRLWGGAGSTRA